MAPRPEKVEELVHAAFAGMEFVTDGTTGDEVLSACFTMTKRAIKTILQHNPAAAPQLRASVEMLYLACISDTPIVKDIQ